MANGRCGLSNQSKAGGWHLPTKGGLLDVFSSKSLFRTVWFSYYWSDSMGGAGGTPLSCHANSRTCLPLGKSGLSYVWPVRTR